MKEYKGLSFEPLSEKDISELTSIMTRAFDEDSRLHLNEPKGGPPGYDDGSFLRKYGLCKESDAYKISADGSIIGCVIVWINRITNINHLGCLFLDTDNQNKGLGKTIWNFVEQEYPRMKKWTVETPAFSRRNHNFYVNKCGFHVVKIVNPKDLHEGMYVLEKVME